VVWTGETNSGDVFARRFAGDGTPLSGDFRVNTYTPGQQRDAVPAMLADSGEFLVAWTSVFQDGSVEGVHAQLFDAQGIARGGEFRVNEYTTGTQRVFGVAGGPGGAFVVAWQSRDQDGAGYGVHARRVDRRAIPVGAEFRVNTYTTGNQLAPAVDVARSGEFTVVWTSDGQDGSSYGVYGQRFDPSGTPLGGEFRVNQFTSLRQTDASIAFDGTGGAVVTWSSELQDGDGNGVYARRYDAGGLPLGGEFRVNVGTTGSQRAHGVGVDVVGDFVIAFTHGLPTPLEIRARRFLQDGTPTGNDFQVNTTPVSQNPPGNVSVALDAVGNFVVDWTHFIPLPGGFPDFDVLAQRYGGLFPASLRVDTSGNGVLEPGETAVPVRPSWANRNGASQSFDGLLANPSGPSGGVPAIPLAQAAYGTLPHGATAECASCYMVSIPSPSPRPVVHWDATADERILPLALGQQKRWTLHVGESFDDVPPTSGFYRFIETLLHHGVSGGCGATTYCPLADTTREQMAVFVLVAKEGAGYAPPACGATPVFSDVPSSNPFCRWIEELARRGVVSGCGSGNYCPTSPVTREEMAVFVLRTLDPALQPPACTTPIYNDVPATSGFCRWIEELTRRTVVTGCGGGNYCPVAPVTREQMGVFIGVTFGLALYGP
jgi:hypothetical protein